MFHCIWLTKGIVARKRFWTRTASWVSVMKTFETTEVAWYIVYMPRKGKGFFFFDIRSFFFFFFLIFFIKPGFILLLKSLLPISHFIFRLKTFSDLIGRPQVSKNGGSLRSSGNGVHSNSAPCQSCRVCVGCMHLCESSSTWVTSFFFLSTLIMTPS